MVGNVFSMGSCVSFSYYTHIFILPVQLPVVCSVVGLFSCRLFALGGSPARTNGVSLEKELQKQKQITSIHDQGGGIVGRIQSALGWLLHIQDEASNSSNCDTKYHLHNLRDGNPDGLEPLGFQTDGHEEVIKVHNSVNSIVHNAVPRARGSVAGIGCPAKEQDGNMVVPVEKNEFLFVNNNEEGIQQLTETRVRGRNERNI